MKPEIKQKWVEALRSGDYQQGTGQLRNLSHDYCCLGVLCDLHSKETGIPWSPTLQRPGSDKSDILAFWNYAGSTVNLNDMVRNWAGIDVSHVMVFKDGQIESLANLNDSGTKFAEIADLIEETDFTAMSATLKGN